MTVLNATKLYTIRWLIMELYALKWLILCFVNDIFTDIFT